MSVLAATAFQLVDQIAAATTVAAVWKVYLDAAGRVSLPFAVAAFIPPGANAAPVIVADAMPPHWLQTYFDKGLDAGDLLTPRARSSPVSFEWRLDDWPYDRLTPIQKRWYDHNKAIGIHGGLVVKDFRRGEDMVMVVCGPDGALHPHDRLALYFAGHEAMLRLRELADTLPPRTAPLSQRERECLQWAAAGKTDWEIGQILSLSEKTVNVYVERAKAKFGVTTRAQAVVVAMRGGMIAV